MIERAGRGPALAATFDFRFDAATEPLGGMKLRVSMSAPDAEDMDVFVAVQKLDAYGDLVGLPFYALFEDGRWRSAGFARPTASSTDAVPGRAAGARHRRPYR